MGEPKGTTVKGLRKGFKRTSSDDLALANRLMWGIDGQNQLAPVIQIREEKDNKEAEIQARVAHE